MLVKPYPIEFRPENTPMRTLLLPLSAALALAGCSVSEQGVDTQASANSAATQVAAKPSPKPVAAAARPAFASMPDRGALIRFDVISRPTREGSHTNYPIEISEAHALNAVREGGEIQLPTPSGKTMRIAYQKHIEHKDGNWTWVGKTEDGLQALFTFGSKAAFGYVAQKGAEALRVTVADGRAWLVDVDASKVNDGNMLRGSEPDFVVPPAQAMAALERKRSAAAATPTAADDLPANASNTVDVVLGYTNGMVTKFGSVDAANTRLIAIFDLTNAGYEISGITPRVRLVRTVQVAYTDNNSNDTALEALTGYTCNPACTTQPVPAELQPLRTARETYGGDLVSLVRPFRAPEHDSCGIAWLLGGGGFAIDNTDAPFGYSVVSDGTDVDEGNGLTYFCREQTLAHELGHNMGQQHNVEDSGGDTGTHSYSYGYREASTTGFYTVMAYRQSNSSQFSINNFANPGVNYSGRPTGTATADNARSLNQSMLLVVPFRGQVVPFDLAPPRHDINGDTRSDLIWFNAGSSQMAYWFMNYTSVLSTGIYGIGANFRIAATGDFDADTRADLIWANTTTRQLYMWRSRGDGTFDTPYVGGYGTGWAIARTADINGDGRDDVIWENTASGQMAIWYMNGATISSSAVYSVGTQYRIVGSGDFDGDGRGDLLWADTTLGYLYMWRSLGNGSFDTPYVGGYATAWRIVGSGDLNGDGRSDILWENVNSGQFAYWFMNSSNVQSTGAYSVGTAFRISTHGDFDGDTRTDLVWANSSTGFLYMWRSRGDGTFDTPYLASYATSWALIP